MAYVIETEVSDGGLVACGVVSAVTASPRIRGIERQTPRVSIEVKRTALAKRRLGRAELRPFSEWDDGRPQTELNFKLYRQATDKIVGVTDETDAFLLTLF